MLGYTNRKVSVTAYYIRKLAYDIISALVLHALLIMPVCKAVFGLKRIFRYLILRSLFYTVYKGLMKYGMHGFIRYTVVSSAYILHGHDTVCLSVMPFHTQVIIVRKKPW